MEQPLPHYHPHVNNNNINTHVNNNNNINTLLTLSHHTSNPPVLLAHNQSIQPAV